MKLFKIQILKDGIWETDTWESGEPFLFREDEIDVVVNGVTSSSGEQARGVLHSDDPNIHSTPLGIVIQIKDGLGVSTWSCDKAPKTINTCRYDLKKDSACDSCIYCGQPMERF